MGCFRHGNAKIIKNRNLILKVNVLVEMIGNMIAKLIGSAKIRILIKENLGIIL